MRDLSLTALRYAAGDLDSVDEAAFEQCLAADQQAQDALCEAVRLSAAAVGQPEPRPDALIASAVKDQLRPTWIARFFARRPYRGHPMAWTATGAVVAISLFGVTGLFETTKPNLSEPPTNENSRIAISIPHKKDSNLTPVAAVGGGEPDNRTGNRPSTFLPDPPKLDPMGFSDG